MIKPMQQRTFHIPDRLAILAALLLLLSTTASFDAGQEAYSSGEDVSPVTATDAGIDDEKIDAVTEPKPRGLNLGSLLFRRG